MVTGEASHAMREYFSVNRSHFCWMVFGSRKEFYVRDFYLFILLKIREIVCTQYFHKKF